jgi:release factor glutamine methyltransferase
VIRELLLKNAIERLARAGVPEPARDARLALRWAAGLDGAALAAALDSPAEWEEAARFDAAIARRAAREPMSHITGTRAFWGRDFGVGPEVLDPRPETEVLVAEALHRGPVGRVLDLGTGSGCILLTLLAEWPGASGLGTDISPQALARARRNADMLGVGKRAEFAIADWMDGVGSRFDLIVSNPPYIAEAEIADLEPEVRGHEPRIALTLGGDGLGAYRRIAAGVLRLMAPRARLMVEIGPTQSHEVAAILAGAGLRVTHVIPDFDQRPRVMIADG